MLENDRLIRALLKQPVDRVPVWIMRQAGRYMPEYRTLRKQSKNFMAFCQTPSLCCEATLQPLARFPELDAAIIFSDILTIPAAMGLDLSFLESQGPLFSNPLRKPKDLNRLKQPDLQNDLGYVFEAIQLTRQRLQNHLPLIGFSGSPWTLACYMIEGQGSKIFKHIKTWMYTDPESLKILLQQITEVVISYLNQQIVAGANALMLFDTWGGVLTSDAYSEFSLAFLNQIAQHVQRTHQGESIPLIFFTKNGGQWLEAIADSGCDAVGIDWTTDLLKAKNRVGNRVALQGNVDPMLLYGNENTIRQQVQRCMQAMGPDTGYVFNLGHGIDKDTPISRVHCMLKAVHEYGQVTKNSGHS